MSDEAIQSNAARDKEYVPGEGKPRGRKRRKVSYLTLNKIEYVDYKDFNILRRYLNDRGKILSSRQTGNTAFQQRMVARAIRRARELALLPYVVVEMSGDRREYAPRGPRRDRGDYDRPRDAPVMEALPPVGATAAAEAPVATPEVAASQPEAAAE